MSLPKKFQNKLIKIKKEIVLYERI